jgi:hypothetical protein
LLTLAYAGGAACQLRRPDTPAPRMLEPQVPEPPSSVAPPSGSQPATAVPIRLLDTQARGHIGRRLLHQGVGGELTEDPVWLWSVTPDRYLDSALRFALASRADIKLVDTSNASPMAVTLIVWQLESADTVRIVGGIELTVTAAERRVRATVIRGSESVSTPLPGNLAAAAGRLLQRLASESVQWVTQALSQKSLPPSSAARYWLSGWYDTIFHFPFSRNHSRPSVPPPSTRKEKITP